MSSEEEWIQKWLNVLINEDIPPSKLLARSGGSTQQKIHLLRLGGDFFYNNKKLRKAAAYYRESIELGKETPFPDKVYLLSHLKKIVEETGDESLNYRETTDQKREVTEIKDSVSAAVEKLEKGFQVLMKIISDRVSKLFKKALRTGATVQLHSPPIQDERFWYRGNAYFSLSGVKTFMKIPKGADPIISELWLGEICINDEGLVFKSLFWPKDEEPEKWGLTKKDEGKEGYCRVAPSAISNVTKSRPSEQMISKKLLPVMINFITHGDFSTEIKPYKSFVAVFIVKEDFVSQLEETINRLRL